MESVSTYRRFLLRLGEISERCRSPINAILVTGVVCVTNLALYSFTGWIRALSGIAPVGVVFTITRFVPAILSFIKREGHRT